MARRPARLDRVIDAVASARMRLRYFAKLGRWPRLNPPHAMSEHITRRVIFDRDPRLTIICDKLRAKQFVADRVGADYPVPTLGDWGRPEDIDWSALPDRFVFKPNNSSGRVAIVASAAERDTGALASQAATWLDPGPLERLNREWGYHNISPRLMAEPLLMGPGGDKVPEATIFTVGGRVAVLRVLLGRKGMPERRDAWFDTRGRQLDIGIKGLRRDRYRLDDAVRDELIGLSAAIARDFSSLRVDFYLTPGRVWVGELTPYPSAGRFDWSVPGLDERFGRFWDGDFDLSSLPDFV